MVLGLNLDVQDREIKHFAGEVLQKTIFAKAEILMNPGSIFYDFGWPGTNVHMDLNISGNQTWTLACLVASLWCPGGPGAILGHWGAPDLDFS